MNWVVLALCTWVLLGLEVGLKDTLQLGSTGIAPSFIIVLVAVVAMSATPAVAMWSALVLGLLVDLLVIVPIRDGGPAAYAIGPHALGFMFAAQFVLAMRGVMIRRNPFAVGFLAACGSAIAQICVVAIFALRTLYDPIAWNPTHEIITRGASALYTGLIALPLSLALLPLSSFFGLPGPAGRRFQRRGS
jgi:hypothetical protein